MLRRRKPSCRRIAATALILATLSLALPASAVSATRTYSAVNVHCGLATFKLVGLKPATVRAARVTLGQRRRASSPQSSAVPLAAARYGYACPRSGGPVCARGSTRGSTGGGPPTRRRAERHAKRARRDKHSGLREHARAAGPVRRRKRPKLTVIISDPPDSTDPAPLHLHRRRRRSATRRPCPRRSWGWGSPSASATASTRSTGRLGARTSGGRRPRRWVADGR